MDRDTLVVSLDYARGRLLGIFDAIEKATPDVAKVLAWRPGPGRAYIAWHGDALRGDPRSISQRRRSRRKPSDEALVAAYAGGSTPSDSNIPDLATIRATLQKQYAPFREYVATITPTSWPASFPTAASSGNRSCCSPGTRAIIRDRFI